MMIVSMMIQALNYPDSTVGQSRNLVALERGLDKNSNIQTFSSPRVL